MKYLAFHNDFDSAAVVIVEAENDEQAIVRAEETVTKAGLLGAYEGWAVWPLDSLPAGWCSNGEDVQKYIA